VSVFGMQQAVFEMVGLPMVENCLAGFNSSIFAYGQVL
jgi:kinesin family protein 15